MKKKYYCKECKIEISRFSYYYGTGLCRSCSIKKLWKEEKYSKRNFSGKNHPMFGKHHTKKAKQKIRESNYHKNLKNSNNPNYIDGRSFKENNCIDCNKKLKSYRAKRCQSCAAVKRFKDLKSPFCIGKPPKPHFVKYKNIWFRSNWEITYAKWLDKQGIKWQYESKAFNLGDTTYTPDFYLPEFNHYIEIKGYWRKDAKKKFKLFKEKFPRIKIEILDKIKLQSLRII